MPGKLRSHRSKTVTSCIDDDVLIVVHNNLPPLDSEWALYVEKLSQLPRYQLVFTSGGGPNAAQRKLALEEGKRVFGRAGREIPPSAVMTPSVSVRTLVTLFNWMFPDRYTVFGPEDFTGALTHLDRKIEDHLRIRLLVERMRGELL